MDNNNNKKLCLELLNANTEEEIVNILKREKYWDTPEMWRLYAMISEK